MTYPPQGRGEHEPGATPSMPPPFPPSGPPAAPWQGPTQPYGAPAPSYGQSYPQVPQHGQQPYAPPYGQPAPPPAQKSKVGLIAAVTGLLLLVIAGVVVGVLALQSTVLDPAAVERDVAAQFEEREGVSIDLTCDDEMPVEPAATYECTGTTADGEEVTLEIRIEDENSARYTWTEP